MSPPRPPAGDAGAGSTAGQPRRPTPRLLVAGLLLLAVAAGVVGAALFVRAAHRAPLDPRALAIAPLAVGRAGLDSAAAAFEARLAGRLAADGARVLPLDSAARAWDAAQAPAAAAVLLAQRTGAGLVVLAQLWPAHGDSVVLAARLLDVANNRVRSLYEIRAARPDAALLGDSLGRLLVRDLREGAAGSTAGRGTPPDPRR